ncbi:hypothetical protein VB776_16195 [Arcicella sp. DC2W]|uniref:Uncharacterized protein n=1 Tax=Arcicella gelida TaxID=2984195 RepID=A0ABU5S7M0_9BACT|nr:hypothetical protein [Arcicella sp. DC2W]MEA5404474.1 hypothetical protein [Arcicella sp. DC2W]
MILSMNIELFIKRAMQMLEIESISDTQKDGIIKIVNDFESNAERTYWIGNELSLTVKERKLIFNLLESEEFI